MQTWRVVIRRRAEKFMDLQAWRKETADARQDSGEKAVATKHDHDVKVAWMIRLCDAAVPNTFDAVAASDMKPAV